MPSVIATIKVKEDKIEEAKSFLKELCADTLSNESGTLAYVAHQQKDSPTTFVFYEKYESDEAFAIHGNRLICVQFDGSVRGQEAKTHRSPEGLGGSHVENGLWNIDTIELQRRDGFQGYGPLAACGPADRAGDEGVFVFPIVKVCPNMFLPVRAGEETRSSMALA